MSIPTTSTAPNRRRRSTTSRLSRKAVYRSRVRGGDYGEPLGCRQGGDEGECVRSSGRTRLPIRVRHFSWVGARARRSPAGGAEKPPICSPHSGSSSTVAFFHRSPDVPHAL